MPSPLVSILIPAYNAEKWLGDALRSALGQTWPAKEIIVVDDGSKDRTLEVARSFVPRGITVVSQPNQGAPAARNHAYSLARGDYIQWLDADDILAPDKIEQQMKALGGGGAGKHTLLSGSWGVFSYRIRKARFEPTALWRDLPPVEWLRLKMEENLQMQPDAWLVSRELTDAAGPWDVRLRRDNDGEYFCRVILASKRVQFVPDAKSYYRFAGFNSISYIGRSDRKLESLFLSMELHVKYLRSLEDSPEIRAACVRYLQRWLIEFYPFRMDLIEKLNRLAESLGGKLTEPKFSWKYAWIGALAGNRAAREAQLMFNKVKGNMRVRYDKALYHLEKGREQEMAV